MKALTLIVLLSCIAINHLSFGQVVIDDFAEEIEENFGKGFKDVPSLFSFINEDNIDRHSVKELEETILEYETDVLDQVIKKVFVDALTQAGGVRKGV